MWGLDWFHLAQERGKLQAVMSTTEYVLLPQSAGIAGQSDPHFLRDPAPRGQL
jgi:hypothetical protein